MAGGRSELGSFGEQVAADFLERRGVEVVVRNQRVGRGEIDLVVRHEGVRIAVEVKTRVEHDLGRASDAFTSAKERQVRSLADALGIGRVDLVTVTVNAAGVDVAWSPRVA